MTSKIKVTLGGRTVLDGTLLMDIHGSRSRIELTDGTTLVFDGTEAWVSPASVDFKGARFHLLTWPYFIAAPMKLRDPGTALTLLGEKPLDDVVISTTWRFWHWSRDKGKHGAPLGGATLSNVKFVDPPANAFTRPSDAKLDRLPASAG